jgi:hypothetical protein
MIIPSSAAPAHRHTMAATFQQQNRGDAPQEGGNNPKAIRSIGQEVLAFWASDRARKCAKYVLALLAPPPDRPTGVSK